MKKRILSLILALSMVLSVLPLGAFAEGSTQDLTIGSDGYPVGTSGTGWSYDNNTKTLTLTEGTFDFSSTETVECAIKLGQSAAIAGGTFNGAVTNDNHGNINNGTFNGTVINANGGLIFDGTFKGDVTNGNGATIVGGTFNGIVINNAGGEIADGTFAGSGSVENNTNGTIYNGIFNGTVTNNGTIKNGAFASDKTVTNYGTINNGTFAGSVTNHGNIKDGTFEGTVKNYSGGTIFGGTFAGSVQNRWDISGGVFNGKTGLDGVTGGHNITWDAASSKAKIEKVNGVAANWAPYVYAGTTVTITASTKIYSLNGKRIGTDYNSSYPNKNDKKTVTFTMPDENVVLSTGELVIGSDGYPVGSNGGQDFCSGNNWEYSNYKDTLHLSAGTFDLSTTEPVKCKIQSYAMITGGTFNGAVKIIAATITKGIFNGTVYNSDGTISGGTFQSTGSVTNWGEITGGTFAGSVENKCDIYGGVFNRNATLTDVPDGYSITWDKASSKAKITEVNDVSAEWNPYVVVTDEAKTKVVTITADTDIYSLNGYPIDGSPYTSSYPKPNDKKTVTFTMPDENVVLSTGELVMENGYPVGSSGKGWSYDNSTETLTLTSGTFDFSSTHPQGKTPGTSTTTPVACAIQSYATITGGIFAGSVTNDTEGMISGNGTFKGEVKNHNGTISGGKFEGTVINDVNGTISDGTFNKEVSNINGNISNGTFNETVTNDAGGTIYGGTFAGGVNNKNDRIYGGVFNGNATLTNVTGLHSITVASGAKIEKVNDVSADWTPYVVTSNATTKEVTITADTEIFSLNGQPIGAGNCNSSYGSDKTTVTFTMPDDKDVVLNGAITSTDLVMENGYPKDSNGGKTPCKGDGWEYIKNDPTNGDMLLLTDGLFDFSTIGDGSAVECNVFVGKPTAITGGEFNGKVFNNSGILGGTFNGPVDNRAPGIIKDGTFNGAVENNGMIENGAFHKAVENNGIINDGAFNDAVKNNSTINDGAFNGKVENTASGTINDGTFHKPVENDGIIENGTFHDEVKNNGTINDGAFNGKVENNNAIKDGTFNGPVDNTASGTIEKGTFNGAVENNGTINGGVFNGAVTGSGTVSESITGSGTLNGEPITKPEPTPEPEPTTYTVTVIGGTIDGKTSVSAKENDTLTVVLDQNDIPDGMTFDLWSISSDKLSGDINVDYRAEAMTFQMPAEDVTIRAQYRSAEIIEDAAPSPLATAATIAVGGAAAGIVVWQGVSLGVDLYLTSALPQGVPVPTDRRALALLLWETAGKPEVALPTLYGDIPAEEIELQKATRWAIQNGLMDAADKKDASFFDPDHYVTKMDVFGAWLRLKKLLGTT